MILKLALIICFEVVLLTSIMCLSSCKTISGNNSVNWPVPKQPIYQKVVFYSPNEIVVWGDSIILTPEGAETLANNIDGMKSHIEKLELLIKEMESYYNAK